MSAQREFAKTRARTLVLATLMYLGLLAAATFEVSALPAVRGEVVRGCPVDLVPGAVASVGDSDRAPEERVDGDASWGWALGLARILGIPGVGAATGLVSRGHRPVPARSVRGAWGRARAPDPAKDAVWRPGAGAVPWPRPSVTAVWG